MQKINKLHQPAENQLMARFFTQSTVKPILIVRDKQEGTKNDYICQILNKTT